MARPLPVDVTIKTAQTSVETEVDLEVDDKR